MHDHQHHAATTDEHKSTSIEQTKREHKAKRAYSDPPCGYHMGAQTVGENSLSRTNSTNRINSVRRTDRIIPAQGRTLDSQTAQRQFLKVRDNQQKEGPTKQGSEHTRSPEPRWAPSGHILAQGNPISIDSQLSLRTGRTLFACLSMHTLRMRATEFLCGTYVCIRVCHRRVAAVHVRRACSNSCPPQPPATFEVCPFSVLSCSCS